MANYRGKGGTTQRNIIGVARQVEGKNGPCMSIDAQFSVQDPRTQAVKDTNPYLETHTYTPKDGPNAGKNMISHRAIYSMDQWASISEAGQLGPKTKDGGQLFGLKADVFVAKGSAGGLIINCKGPMGPSDYEPTTEALTMQRDVTTAWRAERDAAKAKQAPEAQAEAPGAEAEAPTVDAGEPEFV